VGVCYLLVESVLLSYRFRQYLIFGSSTTQLHPPPVIVSQHEHASISALTALYRRTGLFAWSDCLRQLGAGSPARVVFIIDRCFNQAGTAAEQVAFQNACQEPVLAVRNLLSWAHSRYATAPVRLSGLIERPEQATGNEWDAYSALAELMAVELGPQVLRFACAKLRRKGLHVDQHALHDLAALFANMHLRGALCSFDPDRGEGNEGAWLGAVFYRYALRHVLSADRIEELTDLLESELSDLTSTPEAVLEQREHEDTLHSLPDLLGALPRVQRHALGLYYGFEDREHTVAEIATALGTNVYFARAALVSGLGALTAATGANGLLNHDELRLAQAVFLQGRAIGELAEEQGLEKGVLRKQISIMTRKLQSALRRRTLSFRVEKSLREEQMSSFEPNSSGLVVPPEIPSTGLHLNQPSTLHPGTRFATSADGRANSSDQNAFASQFRTGSFPESIQVSLPPASTNFKVVQTVRNDRDDLRPDYAAWQETLDAAAIESLDRLAPWLALYETRASERDLISMPGALDRQALLLGMRDGVTTVTSALEESLARTARRSEFVLLLINFRGELRATTMQWKAADWESDAWPLHDLLVHRLSFVGGLSAAEAEVASLCAIQVLGERSTPLLPRFVHHTESASNPNQLVLRWVNPLKSPTARVV
jgi:DNA-directed RNA polymerase specialized sigma24 family protein